MKFLEKLTDFILYAVERHTCDRDAESPLSGATGANKEESCPGRSQETLRQEPPGETSKRTDPWGETVRALQIGFTEFTTDRDTIGFYINPDNRWVKLAKDVFKPGMEEIYEEKLRTMKDTTKGERLSKRLGDLKQDADISAYGEQLSIPNIDLAIEKAKADPTVVEGECGRTGRHGYPFRLVFGFLVVQGILDVSDREVCKCVSESPYLQYFLGYESYSASNTVHPTSLVHFKKRLDWETMERLNEVIHKSRLDAVEYGKDSLDGSRGKSKEEAKDEHKARIERKSEAGEDLNDEACGRVEGEEAVSGKERNVCGNAGTLILDATCGPVNIRYPQDFSLLNEARLLTEDIIERICEQHGIPKPRTYLKVLQKAAKDLSKTKKKTEEKIRHVLRIELNAIERNLGHIDDFLGSGSDIELTCAEAEKIGIIRAVYAQQKYMYQNKTHTVTNRIVSISMPFIRPIQRGKADRPTEFGPKYDIAIDEKGYSWLTHFSFDNRNEGTHLKESVESYKKKHGHYPERVLADQIYRSRENRKYCKEKGIRLSGPRLGRKPRNEETLSELLENEKADMVDRIEVERHFSRQKRCFGIECIVERAAENISHAVGMSVFLDNVVPVGF